MKTKIQPKYFDAKVHCVTCGQEFIMGSTVKEIKLDTCNKCHPFYTGTQTFVQAAGRIEKFNKRYGINTNKDVKN